MLSWEPPPQICEEYLQFEQLILVSLRQFILFPCAHVYRTIIFLQILRLLTGFPGKLFQVNLICSINFGETLRKSNVVNLLTCTRVMLYRLHIACKLGISAEGPCSTCPYIDHIHPYTYIPYICIYLCMIYYLLNFLTDRHQTGEIRIGEQIIASPCDADS